MERVFEIRTEPHRAKIGNDTLLFQPEVMGSEFVSAYTDLQRKQEEAAAKSAPRKASATKHAKNASPDLSTVADMEDAMREFISSLLMDESVETFARMRLPQRILIEILEWTSELYGGGSGNPDAASGTSDG